jgi:hypothetical protein
MDPTLADIFFPSSQTPDPSAFNMPINNPAPNIQVIEQTNEKAAQDSNTSPSESPQSVEQLSSGSDTNTSVRKPHLPIDRVERRFMCKTSGCSAQFVERRQLE